MPEYNRYGYLKFDPDDYDPMDVGAMAQLLRINPDDVQRRIKDGVWTVGDLDKAISYVEDCETLLKSDNPDWEPYYKGNMREIYKDLLSQLK